MRIGEAISVETRRPRFPPRLIDAVSPGRVKGDVNGLVVNLGNPVTLGAQAVDHHLLWTHPFSPPRRYSWLPFPPSIGDGQSPTLRQPG